MRAVLTPSPKHFRGLAELSTTTRKGAGASKRLSKVTLAGALALNEDFWSRVELRLYVTKASWNQAAAVQNAATFGANGKTSRTLVGVQYSVVVRVWKRASESG